MFFLQREVILRDLQINELHMSVSDMKGKFIKPTLKKVNTEAFDGPRSQLLLQSTNVGAHSWQLVHSRVLFRYFVSTIRQYCVHQNFMPSQNNMSLNLSVPILRCTCAPRYVFCMYRLFSIWLNYFNPSGRIRRTIGMSFVCTDCFQFGFTILIHLAEFVVQQVESTNKCNTESKG